MKSFTFASAAVAALSLIGAASAALDPIVVKGSKFFHKNSGEQFYIKGVAYQADLSNATSEQQFVDPLADPAGCKRDIPLLQALNTNLIRVYAIDTAKSHDECFKMLEAAGIYVVADLSEPGLSINRDSPAWDFHLYERYTSVIDELQQYTNVMGFFAGNEVTNNKTNTNASPFVKAAVRDMKSYIKSKGYRTIPVGYATNDDEEIRNQMADYFNCGDASDSVDFWGYNIYSWCGASSLQKSGWDLRTQEYEDYNVPVFFAEYGCNSQRPRQFTEVSALYGTVMSPVFSGGIVYMYFEETNMYGLVEVDSSGKATKLGDYTFLQNQLDEAKPKGVTFSSYNPSNTAARKCPAEDDTWAASTELPPTPDESLCNCAQSAFSCVPADNLDEKDYGAIFAYICGALPEGCSGVATNGTAGTYGSYSACESKIRLGWALNQYYEFQKGASDACNFDGQAKLVTPSSTSSSCQSKIDSAGGSAGTVLGKTDGSSSDSKTSDNAAVSTIPSFNFAILNTILVAGVAFFGGFGFFLL